MRTICTGAPSFIGRAALLLACIGALACGGSADTPSTPPTGTPSMPSTPATVASVTVSGEAPSLVLGRKLQLNAVVRDTKGAILLGRAITWQSSSRVARISSTGLVTSIAPGTVQFSAQDQLSGLIGNLTVTVATPARLPGSLLHFGVDSMFDFGAWIYISALVAEDSSRTGSSQRLAIVRQAGASLESEISRGLFPLMYSIAECTDGSIYAASYQNSLNSTVSKLWQISVPNGIITQVMDLNFINYSSYPTLSCDSPTRMFITNNFGGIGELFVVNAVNKTRQSLGVANNGDSFLGHAYSPSIGLLATTQNRISTASPFPQLLVNVNTTNGARTPVGTNQVRSTNLTTDLGFMGARLLGISFGRLVEINTQTGAITVLRTIQ